MISKKGKFCSKCQKVKPLTEFYTRSSRAGRKSYYSARCKECTLKDQAYHGRHKASHVKIFSTKGIWEIRDKLTVFGNHV